MKNEKKTAHTPAQLLSEMQNLVVEAQTRIADTASERAGEAVESIRDRFASVQDKLADVYDRERERVIAGARYTDETIREHPYPSLAVAAGIGVLVGVLLGRRTR